MSDSASNSRVIVIKAEPIELCQLLKFSGLAETGGGAKALISDGQIYLNGVVETQKRKKIIAGDRVTYGPESIVVKVG